MCPASPQAAIAALAASQGLRGLVSDRSGWSLPPVGYLVRGQIRAGTAQRKA